MNLIDVFSRYPTQERCIDRLEAIRWPGDSAQCPHCGSDKVARKADGARVGRWNCYWCKSSFSVLSGTIFEKTKVPLQKWFMAIALVVKAKKSLSSCQLARDLDLNQKTAWYMAQRIRAQMAGEQKDLLYGIVEADETYVGGNSSKTWGSKPPRPPRGRGTRKTPALGSVVRDGDVVARAADDFIRKSVIQFERGNVAPEASVLLPIEPYNANGRFLQHAAIDCSGRWVDSPIDTNTNDGFWSVIKREFTYHYYNRKNADPLVTETCWNHNERRKSDPVGALMWRGFA